MGRSQELLDAAREGDKKIVEKILGQITKRSGPFTRYFMFLEDVFIKFMNLESRNNA